ncbi:pyridine nucleotide-disulfide oxidoreductase family protein [Natronocella acetinitrilica]|uniref:Pyridine nucleotide-disulfide oxidoreductase family protein n=1 Tax=Natronocella acetinitrilica TaxID=414046 RepID=A0AAE3KEL7_9GAMM|nr:FAD-dependent oxidoreductase [Natronocella acetinitrilica]MCP1673222.1 pyridine nucleotide-disulfide oxidoreductase family protein [Natronocella acetinitrilica]
MTGSTKATDKQIVLIGGGHSQVAVLKRFGQRPEPGVGLTLISRDRYTPYSGMLPGYIAGHYSYSDVHIDLQRLADFAGAHLVIDEAVALDRASRQVLCREHPPLPYDLLSINIGSTPQFGGVAGASEHAVPVKPIHGFNTRWQALLERIRAGAGESGIVVVGAGAGGVEMVLAMQYRLRRELSAQGRDPDRLRFHLVDRGTDVLASHNARVRRTFREVLHARGVQLHLGVAAAAVEPGRLLLADGRELPADDVVWVTRAGGAAWLAQTGLALDEQGFIQISETLQTVTDPAVFAAGDIATMVDHPREKAGVIAVRQGSPLARNLRLAARGETLTRFVPQRRWLALISTGDRYAVASRGWFSARGGWIWRWKDSIDRRFMRAFNEPDQG